MRVWCKHCMISPLYMTYHYVQSIIHVHTYMYVRYLVYCLWSRFVQSWRNWNGTVGRVPESVPMCLTASRSHDITVYTVCKITWHYCVHCVVRSHDIAMCTAARSSWHYCMYCIKITWHGCEDHMTLLCIAKKITWHNSVCCIVTMYLHVFSCTTEYFDLVLKFFGGLFVSQFHVSKVGFSPQSILQDLFHSSGHGLGLILILLDWNVAREAAQIANPEMQPLGGWLS